MKIRLEIWSRVYCKNTPCWLWHAIKHDNSEVVAFIFSTRKDDMLWKLLELLSELNIEIEAFHSHE